MVTYAAAGNLKAEEGTLELWFRLEAEPDGSQKEGRHYFPLVQLVTEQELEKPSEKGIGFRVCYQSIWKPDWFHFWFQSSGKTMGKITGNPYITSAEDTQTSLKGDRPGKPYPRIPRLKPGDWHHLALIWSGSPTEMSLFLDGKPCIPSTALPGGSPFEEADSSKISFLAYNYHDNLTVDDLRVSSVARTEKELAAVFAEGATKADKFTLLLDRFENVAEGQDSRPDLMSATDDASKRGEIEWRYIQVVPGKTGKGLKILKI